MNHNRVIVTGGSGFIGSHLTLDLLDTSTDEVVLFDRDPTCAASGSIESSSRTKSNGTGGSRSFMVT